MSSNRAEKSANWPRAQISLAALVVVVGIVVVVWWRSRPAYPVASSPESMYLMRLCYSTCNAKDPARLQMLKTGLQEAIRLEKLTPAEESAFAKIIAMAERQEWEAAEAASFQFAEDQVGRGHPTPDEHRHAH